MMAPEQAEKPRRDAWSSAFSRVLARLRPSKSLAPRSQQHRANSFAWLSEGLRWTSNAQYEAETVQKKTPQHEHYVSSKSPSLASDYPESHRVSCERGESFSSSSTSRVSQQLSLCSTSAYPKRRHSFTPFHACNSTRTIRHLSGADGADCRSDSCSVSCHCAMTAGDTPTGPSTSDAYAPSRAISLARYIRCSRRHSAGFVIRESGRSPLISCAESVTNSVMYRRVRSAQSHNRSPPVDGTSSATSSPRNLKDNSITQDEELAPFPNINDTIELEPFRTPRQALLKLGAHLAPLLSPRAWRRDDGEKSSKRREQQHSSAESLTSTHRQSRMVKSHSRTHLNLPSYHLEQAPLICALGHGFLTSRVFIIRSPTSLDHNVFGREFLQTRASDIRRLIEEHQVSPAARTTNKNNLRSERGLPKKKYFWTHCQMWDLSVLRVDVSAQVQELEHQVRRTTLEVILVQVLSFRLLDSGVPTLFFVSNLCSSLLYWLSLSCRNFGCKCLDCLNGCSVVFCFRESEPIFLSLLGCILLCLETHEKQQYYATDALELPSIENVVAVLKDRSLTPISWGTHTVTPEPESQQNGLRSVEREALTVAQTRLMEEGVMSWKPLDHWNPGAVRLLQTFRTFLTEPEFATSGVRPTPYRLKTIIVDNFLPPLEGISVEIYEVLDLQLIDGRTQRRGDTGEALVYNPRCSSGRQQRRRNSMSSEEGLTEYTSEKKKPLKSTADSFRGGNSLARFLRGKSRPKFIQREDRGCHLFGSSGLTENATPDDACLQMRLVADRSSYTVCHALEKDGMAQFMLDFTGTSINSTEMEERPTTVLSGDVIIVFRQLGRSHLRTCKECQTFLMKSNETPGELQQHVATLKGDGQAKQSFCTSQTTSGDTRGEVFAFCCYNTTFLLNTNDEAGFIRARKSDLDIPVGMKDAIPDDFSVYVIAEPYEYPVSESSHVNNMGRLTSRLAAVRRDERKKKQPASRKGAVRYWNRAFGARFKPSTAETSSVNENNDEWETSTHESKPNSSVERRLGHTTRNSKSKHLVGEALRECAVPKAGQEVFLPGFTVRRPKANPATFVRHHKVIPDQKLVSKLVQEGYDPLSVRISLKVTNNQFWGAVQFLHRFFLSDDSLEYAIVRSSDAGDFDRDDDWLRGLAGAFRRDIFYLEGLPTSRDTSCERGFSFAGGADDGSRRCLSTAHTLEGMTDFSYETESQEQPSRTSRLSSPVPKLDVDYVRRLGLRDTAEHLSSFSSTAVPGLATQRSPDYALRSAKTLTLRNDRASHAVDDDRLGMKRRHVEFSETLISKNVLPRRQSIGTIHCGPMLSTPRHPTDPLEDKEQLVLTERSLARRLQTTRASPITILGTNPGASILGSGSRVSLPRPLTAPSISHSANTSAEVRPALFHTAQHHVNATCPPSTLYQRDPLFSVNTMSAVTSRFPGVPPFAAPESQLNNVPPVTSGGMIAQGVLATSLSGFPGCPPSIAPESQLASVLPETLPHAEKLALSGRTTLPGYPPFLAPESILTYVSATKRPTLPAAKSTRLPGYPPFAPPESQLKGQCQIETGVAGSINAVLRLPGYPPSVAPESRLSYMTRSDYVCQTASQKAALSSATRETTRQPSQSTLNEGRFAGGTKPTAGMLQPSFAEATQLELKAQAKSVTGSYRKPPPLAASPARQTFGPKSTSPPEQHKAPLGRKIFWKPLTDRNIEGTVFAEITARGGEPASGEKKEEPSLDVSALVDTNVLSRLFVKQATTKDLRPSATKKFEGKALLEAKRAQNLSIILARLPHSPKTIAEMLVHLNASTLSVDELDKIESVILTPEEDRLLIDYFNSGGLETGLRVSPEAKILPLRPSVCYRPLASVSVLRFEKNLCTLTADLRRDVTVLKTATAEIQSSSRFRQVLSVVLRWGNYINHGVAGEDLYIRGFTLGSLLRLTEFKTTIDASITALHFLAANMLHAAPHLHLEMLQEDMPTVPQAAKISGAAMMMNLEALSRGLQLVRSELKATLADIASGTTDQPLQRRAQRLKDFEADASTTIEVIKRDADEAFEEVYNVGRFFGDESAHQTNTFKKNFKIEGLFMTLREFLSKFHACCQDVRQKPKKYDVLLAVANDSSPLSSAQPIRDNVLAPQPLSSSSSEHAKRHTAPYVDTETMTHGPHIVDRKLSGPLILKRSSSSLFRKMKSQDSTPSSEAGNRFRLKRRASDRCVTRSLAMKKSPPLPLSPELRRPRTAVLGRTRNFRTAGASPPESMRHVYPQRVQSILARSPVSLPTTGMYRLNYPFANRREQDAEGKDAKRDDSRCTTTPVTTCDPFLASSSSRHALPNDHNATP